MYRTADQRQAADALAQIDDCRPLNRCTVRTHSLRLGLELEETGGNQVEMAINPAVTLTSAHGQPSPCRLVDVNAWDVE